MSESEVHATTEPSNISRWLTILGIAVLILVSIYAVIRWRGRPRPAPLTIEVAASPEGSEILIDGVSAGISVAHKEIQAGKHELLVSRSGYRPWKQSLEGAGSFKIPVELQPLPMDLRIVPGQDKVEVWLDGEPQVGALDTAGAWTVAGIAEGMHSVRMKTPAGETTATFDFRSGNPPAIAFPKEGPTILFVSSSDGKVKAECNCKAEMQLADSSQTLEPGNAASFNLEQGKHNAELKGLPGGKKVTAFTVGPAPVATLAIFWPSREKAAPDIQTLLNSALNQLKDAKCDSAQIPIDRVLSREPDNIDAIGMSRRIVRLRSLGSCR